MEFCKQFNARTQSQQGLIIPVVITVYKDRSFTFIIKTPPAAILLKRAAGIATASGEPNRKKVGTVTRQQVREIAELEDARPERQRRGHGDADDRGHRAQHGHHGGIGGGGLTR